MALLSACGGSDDDHDMTLPTISGEGIVANPIDCQQYRRGETIPFQYVFRDNVALGNYNIEIHHNFDHHTHGTSAITCEQEAKKAPVKDWKYNQSFPIASGATLFTARQDIAIPTDIDPGDYHFMIRLLDAAGNQQLKAMAIRIVE